MPLDGGCRRRGPRRARRRSADRRARRRAQRGRPLRRRRRARRRPARHARASTSTRSVESPGRRAAPSGSTSTPRPSPTASPRPAGRSSTRGSRGLTLTGGIGYLMGTGGFTCDTLVGAEVVTADGEVVRAGEDGDPELLWALRGGGGNFGVVTAFEYRLQPLGELQLGRIVVPIAHLRQALEAAAALAHDMPDELEHVRRSARRSTRRRITSRIPRPTRSSSRSTSPSRDRRPTPRRRSGRCASSGAPRRHGRIHAGHLPRDAVTDRHPAVRPAPLLEGPLPARARRRRRSTRSPRRPRTTPPGHSFLLLEAITGPGPSRAGGRRGIRPARGALERVGARDLGGPRGRRRRTSPGCDGPPMG